MDLHHPILREFPENREAIKRLKSSDERFRKMFEEYHQLDDAIYRIEEEIDFASDQEMEAIFEEIASGFAGTFNDYQDANGLTKYEWQFHLPGGITIAGMRHSCLMY